MSIREEKSAIIARFEKIQDETVIQTVKKIVDQATEETQWSPELEQAITESYQQSERGEVTDHTSAMKKMRERYS